MEFDFQTQAVSLMTVCAIELAGSFGFGFIDQRRCQDGDQRLSGWYAAALAINVVMNNAIGGYICVAMVGIATGAAANFMTSLPASVFGRHNFDLYSSTSRS
ncbi:MAG: hypothetical protein ACLTXL_09705 [Clostridia bacterium]